MWLDLHEIIGIPGASVGFDCDFDSSVLEGPSVRRFVSPPHASGRVANSAGALNLTASLRADMICVCDRCGTEFERVKKLDIDVPLAADMDGEEDADIFPLEGDGIELDTVLGTCFLLDMESKTLCRPDCKGLCPHCGKNLNEGSCSCANETDPRLAVLGQLLDKQE